MKRLLILAIVTLLGTAAFAQIEKPVKWSYAAKKINDKEAVVFLKATVDKGWHIYSQKITGDGPVPTTFTFTPSKDFTLNGKPVEPKGITKFEKAFGINVTYLENTAIFQQKIKLNAAKTTIKGKIEFMTCNDLKCLPPDEVEFSIPLN
jgi:DsbC/DsbD-like thiol-disulfide interchange protein